MTDIFFSIIIPVRQTTDYLKETLKKLKDQHFKEFEIIVVTDHDIPDITDPTQIGPSYKRNLGASKAKGKYLAFLDDDSYPHPDWLLNAYDIFYHDNSLAGLCGPCLTPPADNLYRQASGLFWQSQIGSGGAGSYRNSISPHRFVDDYPSVNLIINKKVFDRVGGFQTKFWPGEDTLLCLDITQKLKKQILYHPDIIVYHHRRPVLIPHLQQITRYALHRGHFARIHPSTSLRLGYLMPSLFLLVNLILLPLYFFNYSLFLFILLLDLIYFSLIVTNAVYFLFKKQNILAVLLFIPTVLITHLYYGFLFIKGFFSSTLNLQPHRINHQTGQYLGG